MSNFNCNMSSLNGNCLEDIETICKCDDKCILYGNCVNCFYNKMYGNRSDMCKECRGEKCDK